jgi:hypothetical protein
VNTLEDNIISDCTKSEMSERVKQVICALCISAWHGEPYHENQNFSQNRYATIKANTNRVMNLSDAPADTWLLALMYVCLLLNHLASAALGWKTPMQLLTGQTPDISPFLHFSFYQPVYYHSYTVKFPSTSNEEQGWWVGIATHVGDTLKEVLGSDDRTNNYFYYLLYYCCFTTTAPLQRTSDCRHNSNKLVISNLLSRIVIILSTSLS